MLSITLALSIALSATTESRSEPLDRLTYERDIRPILKEHCLDCHGAEAEPQGELDLRLVRFIRQGGSSGPAIVDGKPAESLLLQRIEAGEMPPNGKRVPDAQLALLKEWVSQGAQTLRPEPETLDPGLGITPEEREFWSFQPIADSQPRPLTQPNVSGRPSMRSSLKRCSHWD
ncbi:MAG: c-type cytochrome domain-containing protein [Pirellulaceae bacterium]